MKQYVNAVTDICSKIANLSGTANDLENQIHKQEARHYAYVESNETHVSEIEQQLRTAEESIKKSEESIRRNSICIKILVGGLFFVGIALLALTYHILIS